ncbi:serine/threonine-protein kinase [Nocardia sp. NPDC051832]|uniref:serine/threonine-protein kinase n=1 Tax=Nocardia sp. NPDC051832 TaxID=3155673 RepID=UPI00341A17D9
MGAVRFGPYRLERLLGKGGMGEVWLAATSTGTKVALKLLAAEHARDATYRLRFEREAELATALRDPHIVPIHAHGAIDGRLFIEMAYVDGADLAGRLAGGALPVHTAVDIVGQIAGALDTAHGQGLVHRDIKPSNILVRPDGFGYLIDFGLARSLGATGVTASGMAIGTLAYMAPERFTSTSCDSRADVYSLACVLYECLTGTRPFGDTDPAQQMHAHLMAEPPRAALRNPAIPSALDTVIATGMAKNPADRYASAGEFAAAATAALTPNPGPGPHPTKVLPAPGLPPTKLEPIHRSPIQPPATPTPSAPSSTKALAASSPTPPTGAEPAQLAALESGHGRRWYLRRRAAAPQPAQPNGSVQPVGDSAQSVRSAGWGRSRQPVQSAAPARSRPMIQSAASARPARSAASARAPHLLQPVPLVRLAPGSRASQPVRPAGRRRGQVWPSRGPGYSAPARRPARRRKGGVVRKTIGALVVIFLAPFAFAAGCFALIASSNGSGGGATVANPPSISEPTPEPDPDPQPEIAPAGSAVRDGKFEFAVTNIESGVPKIGSQKATGSFQVVTMTVRNISDEGKWFTPAGQKLADDNGNQVYPHLLATVLHGANNLHRNTVKLAPGESATIRLVFDVPNTMTPSRLRLQDSPFSGGVSVAIA